MTRSSLVHIWFTFVGKAKSFYRLNETDFRLPGCATLFLPKKHSNITRLSTSLKIPFLHAFMPVLRVCHTGTDNTNAPQVNSFARSHSVHLFNFTSMNTKFGCINRCATFQYFSQLFINKILGRNNMIYFKHYSNAQDSNALAGLKREFGWQGLGRYWALLELLSTRWKSAKDEPVFDIQREIIRQSLGFRSWIDQESFLNHCGTIPGIEADLTGIVYRIKAPILLELQSKDFGRARKTRGSTPHKDIDIVDEKKDKKNTKNLAVFTTVLEKPDTLEAEKNSNKSIKNTNKKFNASSLEDVMQALPQASKDRWLTLYQDEVFLQREAVKAFGYYHTDNPRKKPKSSLGWSQALSSWFDRSWKYEAKYQKGNSSNKMTSTSILEAISDL